MFCCSNGVLLLSDTSQQHDRAMDSCTFFVSGVFQRFPFSFLFLLPFCHNLHVGKEGGVFERVNGVSML